MKLHRDLVAIKFEWRSSLSVAVTPNSEHPPSSLRRRALFAKKKFLWLCGDFRRFEIHQSNCINLFGDELLGKEMAMDFSMGRKLKGFNFQQLKEKNRKTKCSVF
ncbi:hypothetical protein V6Z11_A12G114700 [Gossypium hirsutum]